jgi:hypothetical protein
MIAKRLVFVLSPLTVVLASCGSAATGEKSVVATAAAKAEASAPFTVESVAQFDEPWAMAFDEGTGTLFVTER